MYLNLKSNFYRRFKMKFLLLFSIAFVVEFNVNAQAIELEPSRQIQQPSLLSACVGNTAHQGAIGAIASGGNILASGGEDKIIRIWDLQTQQQIFASEAQESWIQRIAVTPDGNRVISQDYSDRITIWDVETKRLLFTINPIEGIGKTTALAVSPDSKKFAIANSQTIRIWDLEAQRKIRNIDQGTSWLIDAEIGVYTSDPVTFLRFSQDNQKLYSGGSQNDRVILKVWELAMGEEIAQFQEHTPDTSRLSNVYVTSDEGYMVIEDFGNFVRFQDLKTNERIEIQIKNSAYYPYIFATFLEFHTDMNNKAVIGVSSQGIFIWDMATGEVKKSKIIRDLMIQTSTLSPDGKTIILGDDNGSIYQLDLTSELWLNEFKTCD